MESRWDSWSRFGSRPLETIKPLRIVRVGGVEELPDRPGWRRQQLPVGQICGCKHAQVPAVDVGERELKESSARRTWVRHHQRWAREPEVGKDIVEFGLIHATVAIEVACGEQRRHGEGLI